MSRSGRPLVELAQTGVLITLVVLAAYTNSSGLSADKQVYELHAKSLTVELPFPIGSELPIVPVRINDTGHRFCLDTGSTESVFGKRLLGSFGPYQETVRVRAFHKPFSVKRYGAPKDVNVAGIKFSDKPGFIVADMNWVPNEEFSGFIGMDFLMRFVVQLDFSQQKIRFFTALPDGAGYAIPLYFNKTALPQCLVTFGNGGFEPIYFAVDTGAPAGFNVSPHLLVRLAESGQLDNVSFSRRTMGDGTYSVLDARVANVQVGPIATHGANVCADGGDRNVIGIEYLSRFLVTFDFPGKQMYLRPRRVGIRSDWGDRSGIRLSRNATDVSVIGVVRSSPAEECGIKVGDGLESFEGQPALELSGHELRSRFAENRRTFRLVVSRDDARIPVLLKTRDFSDPVRPEEFECFLWESFYPADVPDR